MNSKIYDIDIRLELEYSKERIRTELTGKIEDIDSNSPENLERLISDVWFKNLSEYIDLYPNKKVKNDLIYFLNSSYKRIGLEDTTDRSTDKNIKELPIMQRLQIDASVITGSNWQIINDDIVDNSLKLTKQRLNNKFSMKKRGMWRNDWTPIIISAIAIIASTVTAVLVANNTKDDPSPAIIINQIQNG